jgi:hypothetical protein
VAQRLPDATTSGRGETLREALELAAAGEDARERGKVRDAVARRRVGRVAGSTSSPRRQLDSRLGHR